MSFIIDVAVISERNTSVKVVEKDLEKEISRLWGMKTEKTAAPGLVKKGLKKFINYIPGNINIWEVQKITLPGTAHTLCRVPQNKLSEDYVNPYGTIYTVSLKVQMK